MRRLPPHRPVALRKRPLVQVEFLLVRSVADDLLAFGGVMLKEFHVALTTCSLAALAGIYFGVYKQSVPATLCVAFAALVFLGACFQGWRTQYRRNLELASENLALRQTPAMIEMRGAELQAVVEGDSGVDWQLLLALYVTPALGESISFSLHKCEIVIRAVIGSDGSIPVELVRSGQAGFTLMMGVHDPESDSGTITVTTEGEKLFVGTVHVQQGSAREPSEHLKAEIILRDSQGGWFKKLDVMLEKQTRSDGVTFWIGWPDPPKVPVFRDDDGDE